MWSWIANRSILVSRSETGRVADLPKAISEARAEEDRGKHLRATHHAPVLMQHQPRCLDPRPLSNSLEDSVPVHRISCRPGPVQAPLCSIMPAGTHRHLLPWAFRMLLLVARRLDHEHRHG